MSASLGTILPALAFLDPIVQDNTLAREFRDALYPQLLYRMEAEADRWPANIGETQIMTRASLLDPVTAPLTAGQDPTPEDPAFEQWQVTAAQWGSTADTNMPSSRTALANIFIRNAKNLGLQAGQSLNRVARNKLFCAYTSGDTVAQALGSGATAVPVDSINGFTTQLQNGQVLPVSAANPKAATISGAGAVSVIAATPNDPLVPLGPGVLTLAASATWAAGARVRCADAPEIIRVGGAATVDGLSSTSVITLREVRQAVATMRRNRVPTHSDGYYHVHLDPIAESQLFNDNEFQRLNQSLPDDYRYKRFAVGELLNCVFFSNSESPNVLNTGALYATGRSGSAAVQASPDIYATMRNDSGVGIVRTIITGGGSIYEKYIDEMAEYASEGGYTGKVGSFSVVNNGIAIPVERVRYIIRAPLDRMQQIVSQSWSFSGDWGIPTDQGGGLTGGRFKRAICIESGSQD